MILQDVTDIKRTVLSFLDIAQFYKAILILKPTVQDMCFYLSSQDLSVYSQQEWERLHNICTKYGKINTLAFHYEPNNLGCSLARSVCANFVWKSFGLMRAIDFVFVHRESDRIMVHLKADRPWNFGVLCNVLCYPQNLFLTVEGPFPIYTHEVYINTPCRMFNLHIVTTSPVIPNVLEKIQVLVDNLKITVVKK